MGVRMFTTARQMETWAHGQEIYDVMGKDRVFHDRLKNIAVIGVKTFGWTFTNRKLPVPADVPYVRVTGPSGEVWEWNDPASSTSVEGDAVEFCQVVAQTRNIADTKLVVKGETAQRWMAIAQCFAGPPNDPPAKGTRYKVKAAAVIRVALRAQDAACSATSSPARPCANSDGDRTRRRRARPSAAVR